MMGIKKRVGVAVASVLGAATCVVGPVAQAEAAPAPAPTHGAYQNGCTLSPDSGVVSGVYFNFHNSCDWHDLCYHYKYYGNSSAGRASCDSGFKSRMRSWCADRYGSWYEVAHKGVCYGVAETYYRAVRTFGGAFF